MRIIAIGDLHGKSVWKEAIKKKADLYIFLGDYIDSFEFSNKEILNNIKEIISLKKTKKDKVILLLGNHDIQYFYYPKYMCSGYRHEMQKGLTKLFNDNKSLFQIAFQVKNYLFTHAGVSKNWLELFKEVIKPLKLNKNLANLFNKVSNSEEMDILHTVGQIRGGDLFGGITWADLSETREDFIEDYHQVVGHTKVPFICMEKKEKSSITYIDCLDSEINFYDKEI